MPLTLAIVRPGRGSGLSADDGLRSTVRRLAFEPEQNVTHRLGYMIAAFTLPEAVPGYRPGQPHRETPPLRDDPPQPAADQQAAARQVEDQQRGRANEKH
jgi:hypothetical protein